MCLPARIEHYDPADLEHLCLAGIVAWGRLRTENDTSMPLAQLGGVAKKRRRLLAPARNAPIAFLLREEIAWFLESTSVRFTEIATLSAMALEVASYLDRSGASFLTDIARGTGLLKVKVEEALWQLVAHGLATGDGIAGLRVLLTPQHKRVERRRGLRVISGGRSAERAMPIGRWSLWRQQKVAEEISAEAIVERRGRQLLDRYGIVFRELLARESTCRPGAVCWLSIGALKRAVRFAAAVSSTVLSVNSLRCQQRLRPCAPCAGRKPIRRRLFCRRPIRSILWELSVPAPAYRTIQIKPSLIAAVSHWRSDWWVS